MKYSKPEIVIKKDNTDKLNLDEIYLGMGDLIIIGFKRHAMTGKTIENCKKNGGKIKRVYDEDENGDVDIMSICEIEKDGKKHLMKIKEEIIGCHIAIPMSMIDEVIKQLEKLKK